MSNINKHDKNEEKTVKLTKSSKIFIFLVISCLVLTLISLIYYNGSNLNTIFFGDKDDYYMDFFNSIFYAYYGRPYDFRVIYPPIINIFYYFITFFIPYANDGVALRASFEGQIVFLVYNMTLIMALIAVIKKMINNHKFTNILTLILLTSLPTLFSLQRGNSVLIALIFLFYFLIYKDSDDKLLKHFALVSLAISFNIKIYPAIFGLLLLKDKGYKDAIICAMYAIILFFVPFLFLGGTSALTNLLTSLKGESSHVSRLMFGWKLNFTNTISYLFYLFKMNVSENSLSYVNYIILGCSIFSVFHLSEKWKQYLLLGVIIIGFPKISYTYTLVFLFPAIVEFVAKKDDCKKYKKYAILLAFAISSVVFLTNKPLYVLSSTSYMVYYISTFTQSLSILILAIVLNIEGIKNYLNKYSK